MCKSCDDISPFRRFINDVNGQFRILSALLCLGATVLADEFRFALEGIEDEVIVSLPNNHKAGEKYPTVFYYHGTSGRPTTRLIRSHTGPEDWIVVGMPYAKRGVFELSPIGVENEVDIFRKVKERLERESGLDPARLYVSGFSKGGWFSGMLLQTDLQIAGAAILGAGHNYVLETVPTSLSPGTPVFVGVGRKDSNYIFGLKARTFFGKLGATVELEAWQGLGHDFPIAGSVGMKEWFALRNGKLPDEEKLQEEFDGILSRRTAFERWWALVEFGDRPYVQVAEGWREKVEAARLKIETINSSIAREARILDLSRQSLAKETQVKTLSRLESIVTGFKQIVDSGGDSPQVEVASYDLERATAILAAAREQFAASEAQRKEVEVGGGFGNGRRRVPRSPLVR